MIFSRLLPRRYSFVVTIIAGLCFVVMVVYNLGFPVSEVAVQLLAVALMIGLLIIAGMLVSYALHRLLRKAMDDEEAVDGGELRERMGEEKGEQMEGEMDAEAGDDEMG